MVLQKSQDLFGNYIHPTKRIESGSCLESAPHIHRGPAGSEAPCSVATVYMKHFVPTASSFVPFVIPPISYTVRFLRKFLYLLAVCQKYSTELSLLHSQFE